MKLIKLSILTLSLFFLTSCSDSNTEKQKKTLVKQKQVHKSRISAEDAAKMAMKKFDQYLPGILKEHDAVIDLQEAVTGDFTGDGLEDVAIYFSLAPVGGGNAIVGQGLTLYKNTGKGVKVIAGYEPDYLFSFDKISNGKIHVTKLEYSENDGRCCPSIKTAHTLTISGNTAF